MRLIRLRLKSLHNDESGQLVAFTAIIGLVLVMFVSLVYNVGVYVGEKMKVQDAADAAAYSQAVWEARSLNYYAYTNRTIMACLVWTSFFGAVRSQKNLWQFLSVVIPPIVPVGPFLAPFIQMVYQFYNWTDNFLGWTRNVIYPYSRILYAEQFAVWLEMNVRITSSDIMNQVVNQIDDDLQVNSGLLGITVGAVNLVNYNTIINPAVNDFNKLRWVYNRSRDGFTAGTSLPRRFNIPIPIIPFVLWVRFGPTGVNELRQSSIYNDEGFFVDVGYPSWPDFWNIEWDNVFQTGLYLFQDNYYPSPPPSELMFFNYVMPYDATARFPSVYAVVEKQGADIPQIDFWGIHPNISAVSRAQVFYWDPDRSRSNYLRSFNPDREPNLWNPFWRARLAQMDAVAQGYAAVVSMNASPLLLTRH